MLNENLYLDLDKNENANALKFTERNKGKVIFVKKWGWLVFDGKKWVRDEKDEVMKMAKDTIYDMYNELMTNNGGNRMINLKSFEYINNSLNKNKLQAMIDLSKSELASIPSEFDKDKMLINCQNGVLNLETGKLVDHDHRHMMTCIAGTHFDPDAKCPRWLKFLNEIMEGDEDMIKYIQRAVGYSMTGKTKEQVLFMFYGKGSNGKSKFIEVIREIMGDYSAVAEFSSFLIKVNDAIRNDIAKLVGKRFVTASESEKGRRLSVSVLKQLTGEDSITARFLRKEYFEFKPDFKIFLITNNKPEIHESNYAIWRRIKVVPFNVKYEDDKKDKDLIEKLLKEKPGIFTWAIKGCLEWQKYGLDIPDKVIKATEEYRKENDNIQKFIDDCCICGANEKNTKTIYKNINDVYIHWCNKKGVIIDGSFSKKLADKGFETCKIDGGTISCKKGIGLKEEYLKIIQ